MNVVSLDTLWLELYECEDIKSSYGHPKNITWWEQPIKSFRNVSFCPLNQSDFFMPVFSCGSVYTFIRKSLHLLESIIIRAHPETRFRPDFLRMLALLPDRDCTSQYSPFDVRRMMTATFFKTTCIMPLAIST